MPRIRVAVDRKQVIEAIRLAAKKLGRPPHRGELPRVAGISHSAVLKHFACLRDAVRACGLEPSRRGLKVPAQDLLEDFGRVAAELGRSPNRNEYLKHGKYAPGTMYANFGSWPGLRRAASKWQLANGQTGFTAEDTERHGEEKHSAQMDADERAASKWQLANSQTGSRSGDPVIVGSGDLEPAEDQEELNAPSAPREVHESDKAIALRWAAAVPALPGELAGKRRVTDVVCAMIVNTLIGAENDWQGQLSRYLGTGRSTQQSALSIQPRNSAGRGGDPVTGDGWARGNDHAAALARVDLSVTSGGIIHDGRPVMGPPFYPGALSNAPANETGVVLLFGMLAGELGFQIEAVRGEYPDIEAKRQIQPGKWQRVWIEVEYESRNFALHGHDPAKCDIIVCWKHNWVKCPKHIEVIELSKIVAQMIGQ